jgi:hypothetical protein
MVAHCFGLAKVLKYSELSIVPTLSAKSANIAASLGNMFNLGSKICSIKVLLEEPSDLLLFSSSLV